MVIKPKKSPYHGLWIFIPVMVLPSVILTALFYLVISLRQTHLSPELNFASARLFGCGCGIIFHISCWMVGVFTEDFQAVKRRLGEFFSNILVSVSLAFRWYWEDVKTLGLAFWIDFALVTANLLVFLDALRDFFELYVN